MKNTVLKLMPIAVGVALSILLMNPQQWLRGLGAVGHLGTRALVAVLFLVFIGVLISANMPPDLKSSFLQGAPVPPELQSLAREFQQLGFKPIGPPLQAAITPPAILLGFVREGERTYGSVFRTGTIPAKTSYDCVSIFEGDRGWLTTGPTARGAVLPSSPGSLRQVFPGASAAELFDRHREALRYLHSRGIAPRPLKAGGFQSDLRASMRRQRCAFLSSPVVGTVVTLWRVMRETTPHIGGIEKKAIAEKQIRKILSGRTS
jgi:hypothetical protein